MQAAHPVAFEGFLAQTGSLREPYERLARIARVLDTIGFGTKEQADRATLRVRAIHRRVHGELAHSAGAFRPVRPTPPTTLNNNCSNTDDDANRTRSGVNHPQAASKPHRRLAETLEWLMGLAGIGPVPACLASPSRAHAPTPPPAPTSAANTPKARARSDPLPQAPARPPHPAHPGALPQLVRCGADPAGARTLARPGNAAARRVGGQLRRSLPVRSGLVHGSRVRPRRRVARRARAQLPASAPA